MAKEIAKKSTKIIAVLKADWHYEAHNGDNVVKKGRRFECNRDHYIDKAGDLVLRHWVQYGDSSAIPAAHFNLFLEETETVITKKVTKKPAKIEGRYIVPVVAEAAE